jgi:predicted transcriptional regulator
MYKNYKKIIAPLENDWKFIKVEKVGRNRWIKITEEGKNAAEFLI